MGISELFLAFGIFTSIIGGIFSVAFGSLTAYWATQILGGVLGLVSALIYFVF